MPISSEADLQRAYQGKATAEDYVRERFHSELHRLLHDRQVGAVQRWIERRRPAATLEIAPGPGRLTRDVRPSGSLVCLEYNEEMIREGQRACGPEVLWVRGNAFALPFDPA